MKNARAKKLILSAAFIVIVLSFSMVLAGQSKDITWFSLFESNSYKIMLESRTKRLEKKDDIIFLNAADLKAMLAEKYGTSEVYTELSKGEFTPAADGKIALPIREESTYNLGQAFYADEKGWTTNSIILSIDDKKYLSISGDAEYQDALKGLAADFRSRLVNRDNTLPDGYNNENLVTIKGVQAVIGSKGMQLDKVTLEALKLMMEKANSDGVKGFILNSAYRSYKEQKGLFDYRFNERKAAGVSDPYAEASKVVAYPGTSEHQTGMALDILSLEYPKGSTFHNSKEYEWLKVNCWDYGFIPRYPEEKIEKTGISFEPWHYRYIGRPLSLYAKQNGLCLEEVVESLQKNSFINFEASSEEKYIFLSIKKGQEFMIQNGLNVEYSLLELTEQNYIIVIKK